MRRMPTALTALALLFAARVACAAEIEIIAADFGLFEETSDKEIAFQPSDIVPKAVGQRYGWIIELRTKKRALAVREEYVLPPPAGQKEPEGAVAKNLYVPDLRRSQVSQRQLVPVDGQIVGEWSVGPDEPAGHRRLRVIVEGEIAATFDFEVR